MLRIAVSLGELVDKITILSIKLDKIRDPAKLENIRNEYRLLTTAMAATGITIDHPQFQDLKAINLQLWEIEDRIRRKEARQEFDDGFIELARQVYFTNDRRSTVKRAINKAFGSELIEEKEYVDYRSEDPDNV